MTAASRPLAAVVVLAAGEGTRMRSRRPKVLHEVAGRSMLGHVLAAVEPLAPARTLVVVGHGRDQVAEELERRHPAVTAVVQERQDGTGHAVRVALDAAPDVDGTVLVLYGDMPLVTTATLAELLDAHDGPATLLSARVADPTGYGRVLRGDGDGGVRAIVEERDADAAQRAVDEINAGVYAFDSATLRVTLGKIDRANAQGELYLTDAVGVLAGAGEPVRAVVAADATEVAGVNDRAQLAAAGAALRDRVLAAAQRDGVTVVDPATTWADVTVRFEPDAVVEPFTVLRGTTVLGRDSVVGPYADLTDTVVGEGARVRASTCVGADVGPGAEVGPYSYLRPGTRLGRGAKAGAYVETKNAEIGDGTKVPHLAYVGDATLGRGSNVGAGTIFVNYDGARKHRTTVGDDVRIGSNNSLVAPVGIGDGAYTAAGSAITEDVPPGALGVARAPQRNIEGWVARRRGAPHGDPADPDAPPADDEGAPQ